MSPERFGGGMRRRGKGIKKDKQAKQNIKSEGQSNMRTTSV